MAELRSFLAGIRTLFLLSLFHLGCIFFSSTPPAASSNQQPPSPKRRKISPLLSHHQPHRCCSSSSINNTGSKTTPTSSSLSIRSYLRRLFLCFSCPGQRQRPLATEEEEEGAAHLDVDVGDPDHPKMTRPPHSSVAPAQPTAVMKRPSSFPSREDVFPCAACGEVFGKTQLLELHQATRHALSELPDGHSGGNIVRIIFQTGWKKKRKGDQVAVAEAPSVHRILKIHNSPKALARFEDYRDTVRSRAAARWESRPGDEERCLADGNERLRFYCATFTCGLGTDKGTCGGPFCVACGIVRHGFSGKDADGIATHGTGWGAHGSLPEELEREFEFMHVRRAMLVCRVVAGRVALGKPAGDDHHDLLPGGVYDSVVSASEDDELVVFNPRAVLPCFLIVYTLLLLS
uniref:Gastrula zinc finger protein xFG20-1 n=1 Tax=Anthurium amnicola TaxID=1678845 RepID=A0A1D1XG74_9ARAE